MTRLLEFIYVAICILAVLDIMNSAMNTQKKIIWTVIVVFVPILGAGIYYFIGRK